MYIKNLKIALDDDSATYYDIKAVYSLLPDLAVAWPKPKTTYLNINGVNGGADLTEALGGVSYDYRQLTLRLTTRKDGLLAPDVAVNEFAKDYDGQRVRIKVLATSASASDYFFRGRLSITADDENKEIRQITCNIYAEPLRYSTTYTPSASGFDIFPDALGENLWTADNINVGYPDWSALTESGGTIDADAEEIDGSDFEVIGNVTGTNKLLRLYTENRVNCTVQVVETDGETERIVTKKGGSSIYFTNGKRLVVRVYRVDTSAAASFSYSIRKITTNTVNNSGKSVPFELLRSFYPNVETKPSVYVNGTIFKPKQSDNWLEYAPAVLKSGENIVAAFVDSPTYAPALSGGEFKMRYRKGVL